ncbi:MAG: glycosyltransferase family 2 protein, partial [Pseudobutyrivibrio sp.]|nr:glycosyltransferase family 2 protein [Pseudobutyrivibrio sp.]
MEKAKIDVIIPVYNDRNYLMECTRSVLYQDFKDLTLTLVDDCSTDGSSELCDSLAVLDSRVQVIHNSTNLGVSGSREAGFNATESEWVFFMDHDDLIKEDTLQMLMDVSDQGNLICGRGEERLDSEIPNLDWNVHDGDGSLTVISGHEACEKIVSENHNYGYIGSLWNKLISRKLMNRVLEETMKYKDSLSQVYFEDALCMPLLWHHADTVVINNSFCYVHRRLGSSLSVSLNINDYLYQLVKANEIDIAFLKKNEYDKAYEKILLGMFLMCQSVWYRSFKNEKDRSKKAAFDKEVSRIFERYYNELLKLELTGSQKLQLQSIKSFKKNRIRWARTFGFAWFEGI